MPRLVDVRPFMHQVPRFHKKGFKVVSSVLSTTTTQNGGAANPTNPPNKSNSTSKTWRVYTHQQLNIPTERPQTTTPPNRRRRRRHRRRKRVQTTALDRSDVEQLKAMDHFLALAKQRRQTSKQQQQTKRPSKTLINFQAREHTIAHSLSASLHALTETNNETDPKKTSAKIVRHASMRMSSPGQHQILLDRWTEVAENRSREATLSRMRKENKDARSYKFIKLNQRKQFDVRLNGIMDRKKKEERRQAREREERVKEERLRVKHHRLPTRIRSKDNGLLKLTLESKRIFGRF